MTTPNESNDLPGELSIAEGVKQQRWPHTIDAAVWADEWFKVIVPKPGIASDRATMIGWFANAIMAGYDTARMRHRYQPNEIPTPRTDAEEVPLYGPVSGRTEWVPASFARQLERELAEAKDELRNVRHNLSEERDQLKRELAEASLQRDEALVARDFANEAADRRAKDRDQWRECAGKYHKATFDNDALAEVEADSLYNQLCKPSPTPSSPPPSPESQSEQCPDPCCTDGLVDTGAFTPWGSPIEVNCQHPSHTKPSSPPSSPTAHASSAPVSVPETPDTASRLQALERNQVLQSQQMDFLLALVSALKLGHILTERQYAALYKTEWPADLAPTESTSISQPTPKPSASANEQQG